ncbi:putative Transcription factor SPT20-like 3, partial [Homarus americanus]
QAVAVAAAAVAAAAAAGGASGVSSASSTTTMSQHTQPNVIIVSNGEGGVKKSVTVVTKPIAVTSSAALPSLISAQPVQQTSGGQHQVVVARSANITNILSRATATAAGMAGMAGGIGGTTKLAVAVTTGPGISKISLPSLTTQLSRSVPAYSQAVSLAKTQVLWGVSAVVGSCCRFFSS